MKQEQVTHAIGIDISDGSLELANVQERRDGVPVLTDYARVVLPEHVIVHGHIQDELLLREALHELLEKTSIDPKSVAVCTALPDAQILTKIIPLPHNGVMPSYSTLHRSAEALYRALKYRIPDPIIRWTYRELTEATGELTLYATKGQSVKQWQRFFKKAGMTLVSIEMESLALHRSLIKQPAVGESIAVIDFGFRMTTLSVTDRSGLRYSHTIDRGGFDLTKLVTATRGLDIEHAEREKMHIGLVGKGDAEIQKLLKNEVQVLLKSIATSLEDYGKPISSILITGGGARLRGIRALTQSMLKTPTKRGIPWFTSMHITKGQLGSSELVLSKGLYYAGALGLAVRGMNRYTLAKGINFIGT